MAAKRVRLTGKRIDLLVAKMVEAVSHAAAGEVRNKVAGRGAPPDNARIILASDVCLACEAAGLSAGRRYVPPESFAVKLVAVASLIWPSAHHSTWNPRRPLNDWNAPVLFGIRCITFWCKMGQVCGILINRGPHGTISS